MKRKSKIDYFPLTQEDLNEYKVIAKRSLKIRFIFFLIFLLPYINLVLDSFKSSSYINIIIFTIFYTGIFYTYFIYFAFKPVGIRYGRISKKFSVIRSVYYNVYFDDIHESLVKVNIHSTKEHPTASLKDKVKVVKTRFGALYIYVYEYHNERKNVKSNE